MIKLHGIGVSNYTNAAKLALIEKQIPFQEVSVFPSREPDVLAGSPMGKVPWIETDDGVFCETNVIYDYLEDIAPQPALYPEDPFARAKTKEIIRVIENYLDLPARRHLPTVYFGAPVNDVAFEEVRPALENGLQALAQLAKFSPYIAGDTFSFADIDAYFQIGFTNMHTKAIYDWDVCDAVPGLADYLQRLRERKSVDEVATSMENAIATFQAQK